MKLIVFVLTTSIIAQQAFSATVVLIDGTTRNGAFSTISPISADDGDVVFNDTASWTNVAPGGTQTIQAVRNAPASLDSSGDYIGASGGYNAVVSEVDNRWHGNDTGHTVSSGDTFDASYHWIDAFNWEDGTDQVALRFFTTTDNLIGGTEEDNFVILSGTSTTNASYQEFANTGISLPTAFNGDRLFVAFYGQNGGSETNGFARVDDFSLSVIPEPSTALLAGLASLGLFRRRR